MIKWFLDNADAVAVGAILGAAIVLLTVTFQ